MSIVWQLQLKAAMKMSIVENFRSEITYPQSTPFGASQKSSVAVVWNVEKLRKLSTILRILSQPISGLDIVNRSYKE